MKRELERLGGSDGSQAKDHKNGNCNPHIQVAPRAIDEPLEPGRDSAKADSVMAELIQQYVERIRGAGAEYIVRACGEQSADGTWNGWLEFHDAADSYAPLRGHSLTRHSDRGALTRWAAGLEKRDFARAFEDAGRDIPAPAIPSSGLRPPSPR